MKHPQTLAEEMYPHFPTPKLKSIKDNACCAFTLLWWLGIDCEDIDAIMIISDLIKSHALDEDCTVYWGACIKQLTGREIESVEKPAITSIKKIKERTIVRFMKGKVGHWVGVENGKVVFNSLATSKCVEEGKPAEARIIRLKGGKK